MRLPLILISFIFAMVILFFTVADARGLNYPPDADCMPQSTELTGSATGSCDFGDTNPLTKTTHWNLSWPDGHFDGLSPSGNGQCTYRATCNPLETSHRSECWPEFHQPVKTAAGSFSILVVHKTTQRVRHDCAVPIFQWDQVFCNSNGQEIFSKDHSCPEEEADEGCGGELPPECDPGQGVDFENCCCVAYSGGPCLSSPVLVDVLGNGFDLTNLARGVVFDINNNGIPKGVSWTAAGGDDSFLALDRNGNGKIDSGGELFGNNTPQSPSPNGKNGFIALADFDKIENGGNDDGLINRKDSIFPLLRLWQDINHNGVSENAELKTLSAVGLARIDLDYRKSRKQDEHGNLFRYRAKVRDKNDAQIGRWAWDVFLITQP